MTILTNLILTCGHMLYGIVYQLLDHKIGEEVWCPTCGLVGITEVESTYEMLREEQK